MRIFSKPFIALAAATLLSLTATTSGHAVSVSVPDPIHPYEEQGDAGGLSDFQRVVNAAPYDGLIGSIGGSEDPVDAFAFFLAGGDYIFVGGFDDGDGTDFDGYALDLALHNILTDTVAGGLSSFSVSGLPAGNYILQITTALDADPPFTVFVTGPTDFPIFPFQVPEPSTLALFGLGLAGLGLMRLARMRRRRAA